MRYLSFDIECAKTYGLFTPICNFGYALYDSDFQLLEQKDIIINPKTSFKLEGRTGRPDVKLYYSKEEYSCAQDFNQIYPLIRSLLEHDDQIIVNHAVQNDIEYLRNECRRYELPMIEFSAYDTLDAYKAYSNNKKSVSLDRIVEAYSIGDDFTHHKAVEDAKVALDFFLRVCNMMEIDPITMIDLAQMKEYKSLETLSKNAYKFEKERIITQARKMKVKRDFFNGKPVSMSVFFENDIDVFEGLIISIYQLGGVYTSSVSAADYFIYQDNIHCKRCDSFIYNKENGKQIEGLTYDEYQDILIKTLFQEINH